MRDLTSGWIEVTDLPLATIFRDYGSRITVAEPLDLDEAGEFMAIAARLLLAKSSRLLAQPAAEQAEEEPAQQSAPWLEPAVLAQLAAEIRGSEGRESLAPEIMSPSVEPRTAPRPVSILQRAWLDLTRRQSIEAVPVAIPAFVHLESAVSSLLRRLRTSPRVSFRRLLKGARKPDVVTSFLAVLELVRRRSADVEQPELFGEMTIEYREDESQRAARAG